jgi:hypothetical protein
MIHSSMAERLASCRHIQVRVLADQQEAPRAPGPDEPVREDERSVGVSGGGEAGTSASKPDELGRVPVAP